MSNLVFVRSRENLQPRRNVTKNCESGTQRLVERSMKACKRSYNTNHKNFELNIYQTEVLISFQKHENKSYILHQKHTEKATKKKHYSLIDKYEYSGILQLTCPKCNMKYTGQTDRSFRTCFQEHLGDFKHGIGKYSFAQHLLENGHDIGPIEVIMSTIYITNKGRLMDTLENNITYSARQR